MAENEGFDGDALTGGSFSQLLESGDFESLDIGGSYIYPSSFPSGEMLCFGDVCIEGERGFSEAGRLAGQLSGITGSDSSSASSSNNSGSNKSSKLNKSRSGEPKTEQGKRNGSIPVSIPKSSSVKAESQKTCKKPKTESPASTVAVKVGKEKLGDRITALQQLVSPFGKTDTASVLHEAMGYIRFLHDQVQVLSTPYLQRMPSSDGENKEDESKYDLKSRGLCLVPVACTGHVANSNGADFWSPAMGKSTTTPNSKSKR